MPIVFSLFQAGNHSFKQMENKQINIILVLKGIVYSLYLTGALLSQGLGDIAA